MELKQQIAHLIAKFGFEAVEQELKDQNPIHIDGGQGDGDADADDGVGGIQDDPTHPDG